MAAARIAVAGGGLAGLAAGIELHDGGCEVHLFERSRLLGGRATSFEIDGHEVDNGQHVYLACCTEFIRFVERAGMGSALKLQPRFEVAVFHHGMRSRLRAGNLPAPYHLLASMLFYRHLGAAGKVQIARALRAIERNGVPSNGTFAQWLHEHGQGDETVRAFWEPFMVPALNAPLDRMNAAEAAFVISTAFLNDRGAARIGYSIVPLARIMESAAERFASIRRSTAVTGIEKKNGALALMLGSGTAEAFDGVVLAVPPRALGKILSDTERYGVKDLDAYEATAIMDVHLWHDRGRLDFDFAALLDSPVQWIFQKDDGYLCCSLSAADAVVTVPTGDIVQRAWHEVRRAVPQLAGARLLRGAATRNPEGTYSAKPGIERPGVQTGDPSVVIAGSWTATGWPDTMESAVRSGSAAAQALMRNAWIAR